MENSGIEELDRLLINTLFEVAFHSTDLIKVSSNHIILFVNLTRIYTSFFPLQVVVSESRNAPFILFMKDAEKSIVGNGDPFSFKSRLENLPDNVVVIGSHTHTDSRKEKVITVFLMISVL